MKSTMSNHMYAQLISFLCIFLRLKKSTQAVQLPFLPVQILCHNLAAFIMTLSIDGIWIRHE